MFEVANKSNSGDWSHGIGCGIARDI